MCVFASPGQPLQKRVHFFDGSLSRRRATQPLSFIVVFSKGVLALKSIYT